MQSKVRRGMLYFVRSFLFSALCRCGRFLSRKILPFCLCLISLFSVFALPSYAYENLISNQNLTQWNISTNLSSSDLNLYYNDGISRFQMRRGQSTVAVSFIWEQKSLRFDHEYQLSFKFTGSLSSQTAYSVYPALLVFDTNGNAIDQIDLGPELPLYGVNVSDLHQYSFSFVPNQVVSLSTGYTLGVCFYFVGGTTGSTENWQTFMFKDVKLFDLDDKDEAGFFESVGNWLSRIYHSIVGGEDAEGIDHVGLIQGIVSGFSNAINNIQGWLNSVKQAITDKLESVKTAISNAIAGIQQWFIDLKDNIINGLKSLFIPEEGFFEDVLDELDEFCTEHFGAVYQVGTIIAGFIVLLTRLNPSLTHTITMPAIEFEFQGQTWHLCDSITYSFDWVYDSSHPLAAFYLIYKAVVFLILLFLFLDFCHKKYNQVINNFNPDIFDM